ncbi:MAG: TIGR02556 family CRISPR-associated protein [Saprospiraceae bacterium]|nr:TIGR02556 family CRISPR-associated protein [Saprospiraceae bacterium]
MQDQAIVDIGRVVGNRKEEPYQNFIQNMFPGKNYDMILPVFEVRKVKAGYQCRLDKIDVDRVSEKNYIPYAYRKGSARAGDITFTTKFGDLDKKFKAFYPRQVKQLIAFAAQRDLPQDKSIFESLQKYLEQSGEDLKQQLQAEYESLAKQQQMSTGFSIRFKGEVPGEYLADYESVQQLLYQEGTAGKSSKHQVISEGYDECCSICHEVKPVLHGFAAPFKYATVDKTGLVSGFFKHINNWRNYPICTDCALDFELGKHYITAHLSKSFYRTRFFAIPKLVAKTDDKLLKKAIRILTDLEYRQGDGKGQQVASREEALMRKIGEEAGDNNLYTLNLLFYEENTTTKAIKIKLFLEEIFPSRFRKLFITVPKIINVDPLFQRAITVKKEPRDLQFNFGILKDFFESDFYQLLQTVFRGSPMDREALFSQFMHRIRANFNKAQTTDGFVEPLRWTLLKAMMTYKYLEALNIISNRKTSYQMEETKEQMELSEEQGGQKRGFDSESFRNFIEQNSSFFDLPEGTKVGVFAVGVLVRQVFNWQARQLEGNTPFEKKLKGYNLNADHLKNIYLEALEKLSQYSSFHAYQPLRNIINEYFVLNSHRLHQYSNNELSFYFVSGLEFGNQFKTSNENE